MIFGSNVFIALLLFSAICVSASENNLGDQASFHVESQNLVNEYEQTAPIPLTWESECIGVYPYPSYGLQKTISYVYICTLYIDDFSGNDTNIKGIVEFRFYKPRSAFSSSNLGRTVLPPECIDNCDYECSAKAAFTGTLKNNIITMGIKEEGLISGSFPEDFSPMSFSGCLNQDLTQIIKDFGEANEVVFKSKYEIKDEEWDSGFIHKWEDGNHAANDYRNNNSFYNIEHDFFGRRDPHTYKIYSTKLLKKIKENCLYPSEYNNIKKGNI